MIRKERLEVVLSSPLVVLENFSNAVNYHVKTQDSTGKYECVRSYTEFIRLRKVMCKKWPGVYMPPIPGKTFLSNLSSKFVKTYKKQLEIYLEHLINSDFLSTSEEFQCFLKSKIAYNRKYNADLSEISMNFQAVFHEYSGRQLTNELHLSLLQNEIFFTESLEKMITFRDKCEEIMLDFKEYHSLLASSSNHISTIEKSHLNTYSEEETFVHPNLSNVKNHYSELFTWAENEVFEIESILQTILSYHELENVCKKLNSKILNSGAELEKVDQNKLSLSKLFSFKSKAKFTGDMKQKISDQENELQNMQTLQCIILCRLLEKDLPLFKKFRVEAYIFTQDQYNQTLLRNLEVLSETTRETSKKITKI